MADDLSAKIMQDYPSFAYLLSDPEIGPLLLQAVDPNVGFDAATFQAKLMQTAWWKTTSATQRQWVTLYNTDRATADAQLSARHAEMRDFAASLGLEVPDQKLWDATEISLHNGLATNSAQIRDMLSWFSPQGAPSAVPGLKAIAQGDYMIPLSDGDAGWWSREIAAGHQTQDTFKAHLISQAIGRFPQLKNVIDSGITPGQYFSSYKQLIGQQLEVPAESIDLLNDPKWQQVISFNDGGQIRPMTLAETTKLARSQDAYKRTQGGQQLGAQVGEFITKTFGKVS